MTDMIHDSEDAVRGFDDLARFEAGRAALLEANEGYDITKQHDACGVGLVCAIDGKPRREVVELAIKALKALWHRGADAALVEAALLQSRLTHAHPRAEICCALYCLWARAELGGAADGWATAVATLRGLCPLGSPHRDELEQHVRPDAAATGAGSGYVVDCLHSARRVLESATDYAGAVRAAIALGNDTDTTACVTGGIAGLRFGSSGIPARWREALRGRELLDPLLARLLQRSETGA